MQNVSAPQKHMTPLSVLLIHSLCISGSFDLEGGDKSQGLALCCSEFILSDLDYLSNN